MEQALERAARVSPASPRDLAAMRAADETIKADLRARIETLTLDLRAAQTEALVVRAELTAAYTDLRAADADRQASDRRVFEYAQEIAALRATLDGVIRSRSWRVTAPMRDARRLLADGGTGLARSVAWRVACTALCALVRDRDLDLPSSVAIDAIDGAALPRGWPSASLARGFAAARGEGLEADLTRASRLAFASADAPFVSIVIPVHGQLEDTLHCLHAVARHWPRAAAEVLVVDDASPDGTLEALAGVPGLRLLHHAANEGFIRSCNFGAREARGQYLVFLNNDTEVQAGWCDELLRAFEDVPRAGVVGAKLLYPDGRLQEAGGIIWRDGSGWNYGRNDHPDRPEYGYRREVDYVSGAALAIPRALFQRFGGFDERYLPAYGEDSDLAFKVREAGLAVIYQPTAQVIHREGGTAGTDLSRGAKACQIQNAQRLFERWRARLVTRPRPGADVARARERGVARRVLVIDHCTPEPDKDAGSITARNLMRLLQRLAWKVSFIPEDNFLFLDGYTTDLQRMGVECHYAPHTTNVEAHLRQHGDLYDLVLIFRFAAARRHLEAVRRWCPTAKVVVHTSDLHYLRETREAELRGDAALLERAERTRQEELALIQQVDAAIVHSPVEQALLRAQCHDARVCLFGWAIEVPGTTVPVDGRRDLVFLGGYQHAPNVDAVLFFVQAVMPLIRTRLPGVRFHAVGSNPPECLCALASADVIVTGYVPDLRDQLDRMRVAVAPLRYGAGIKGKVVTTMSHGVPGVITSVAAEGLGLIDGEHTLVADSPEAIADAVATLYNAPDVWTRMSQAGLALVEARFGFEGGVPIVRGLLDAIDLRPPLTSTSVSTQTLTAIATAETATAPWTELESVRVVSQAAYREHLVIDAGRIAARAAIESRLCPPGEAPFFVEGYCVACHAPARFHVSYAYSTVGPDGARQPNWREHLVCGCGLNARTRLALHVLLQMSGVAFDDPIYLMEQTGPLFRWLQRGCPRVAGSEFLGEHVPRGALVDGIRNEDATWLSFADASFAQILSFDVFEHVPDYRRAFAECFRCLRPGGRLLFTVPFLSDSASTLIRARIDADGRVDHLLPPERHGDPMNAEDGILCFQHFGWDLLDDLKAAGFAAADAIFAWSRTFGYLGGEQVIFEAVKPSAKDGSLHGSAS
jgi:GT2 family glycosyltransferase/glycosyltransferase involved in cell wall biosynthesis/SAM-dependent methyltransferase